MEENQQNMGIRDKLLFRQLLAKLIELKIVKYNYMPINNKNTKVFWIE